MILDLADVFTGGVQCVLLAIVLLYFNPKERGA